MGRLCSKDNGTLDSLQSKTREGFKDKECDAIYELVTRRFLACCSIDAKGYETVVTVNVGFESFHIHGLSIEEAGYLEVYPYDHWSERVLPTELEKVLQSLYRRMLRWQNIFERYNIERLALVEAFEACEAYLARPTCRSEQEKDLRQIGQGIRDASDVLYTALSAFTGNLQKISTSTNILRRVFSSHFDSN
ncbi:DNA topoisomerase 3-alpha [Galdieria sulphuraria]|nr:DNA topoisomerase 3-alpha [Galdieria sulphuraria]